MENILLFLDELASRIEPECSGRRSDMRAESREGIDNRLYRVESLAHLTIDASISDQVVAFYEDLPETRVCKVAPDPVLVE